MAALRPSRAFTRVPHKRNKLGHRIITRKELVFNPPVPFGLFSSRRDHLVTVRPDDQARLRHLDDHVYVYDNPLTANGVTLQGVIGAFAHTHARNWHFNAAWN